MRLLGYNRMGLSVFIDEQNQRRVGKSTKSATLTFSDSPSDFFLFSFFGAPPEPESIWLCALAFCYQQPAVFMDISRFFNICFHGCPESIKPLVLKEFSFCVLTAFYRKYAIYLSQKPEPKTIAQLAEKYGLPKLRAVLPVFLQDYYMPSSVERLRSAVLSEKINAIQMEQMVFNPFEGLDVQVCSAALEENLIWPLNEQSGLSETGSPIREPNSIVSFSDLTHGISEQKPQQLHSYIPPRLSGDRVLYPPLLDGAPTDSAIPFEMLEPIHKLQKKLKKNHPQWIDFISKGLSLSPDVLNQSLNSEQLDACGMILNAFSRRGGFILADETGLGKGRILAAVALGFLTAGKKVVFITERKQLFSDFWRDLIAIDPQCPPPELLHPEGKIFNASGEVIFKAQTKKHYTAMLEAAPSNPLTFTCYSQFNRDVSKSSRWSYMRQACHDALIILDESHNAAGNSNTKQNIANLLEIASRCLFSSATFAKHEEALSLYKKALPFSSNELELMLKAFNADKTHELARALGRGLTENCCLIRREHVPEDGLETTIYPINSERQEAATHWRDNLSLFFERLYLCAQRIQSLRQAAFDTKKEPLWPKLGGYFSKIAKQMDLLIKIPEAADLAQDLIHSNIKPVFAIESTFESFLSDLSKNKIQLTLDDDTLDDSSLGTLSQSQNLSQFNFPKLAQLACEALFVDDEQYLLTNSDLLDLKELALQSTYLLPDLPASPIDYLIQLLSALNISCSEISGRQLMLKIELNTASISPRPISARETIIYEFNSGQTDALVLTRAGSTGISLHSSEFFQDQRQRALIELEISSNPAARLQFLGRVRRKGQLCAPKYFTMDSGSPFERRWLERAKVQSAKLAGFSGAASGGSAGKIMFDEPIFSPAGQRLAAEWLAANPVHAQTMGLDLWQTLTHADGPVEQVLKRMPLLSAKNQDEVLELLLYGSALETPWVQRSQLGMNQHQFSQPAKKQHLWGLSRGKRGLFHPSLQAIEWQSEKISESPHVEYVEKWLESGRQKFQAQFPKGLSAYLSLSSANASRLAHPIGIASWNNLLLASSHLAPGAALVFTDPGSKFKSAGILCELVAPKNKNWIIYPTCWTMKIAVNYESELLETTLGAFFADPLAYAQLRPLPSAQFWLNASSKPATFNEVSGHCAYERWWLCATHIGAYSLLKKPHAIPALSLICPTHSFNDLVQGKIPLLDYRLAAELAAKDPQLVLDNSYSNDGVAGLRLVATHGGWELDMLPEIHDQCIDYPLSKKLSDPRVRFIGDQRRVIRQFPAKLLKAILSSLYLRGIVFFAPATRSKWHQSAIERFFS